MKRLADWIFKKFCHPDYYKDIRGDLEEIYGELISKYPNWIASLIYFAEIILLFRITLLKPFPHFNRNTNSTAMIKNYFIIAIRHLSRNKVQSFVNIFGLAIGMACCLVIYLYVKQELTFDQFHNNYDRIYRVTNIFERASGKIYWARTPPPLAPAIRNNFPGIEKVTRLRYTDDHLYSVGDRTFYLGNAFFADSLFLEMFDFSLRSGDTNTALDQPGNIVLTQEMASRFFGEEDPMNKLITFDNSRSLKVTGILNPIPINSHINFDMLMSFSTYRIPQGNLSNLDSWAWAGFWTYIQLKEGVDQNELSEQIEELYKQNFNRANIDVNVVLQALPDVYLESSTYSNIGESIKLGNKSTIYGLAVISILILLIAGFNFMNMSTAMSLTRAKEIGIRKVMGAIKGKIINQFLTESVLVSLISLIFALMIVIISAPYFKEQLGVELPVSASEYLALAPIFIMASIIIGLLAGSYPSLVLSAFSPILTLSGNLKTDKSKAWFRKGLLVFQFTISLSLITASLIIVTQMDFIKNKNLGFERENILKVHISREDMVAHFEVLKNKFSQNSKVINVAKASHGFDGQASSGPARLKRAEEGDAHQLAYYQTGYDFLKVIGIKLKKGRYFSKEFPNDSSQALVLNQAAVGELGLSDPVGEIIIFNNRERTVIGVVEDFHFASLHSPIAPMGIVMPFTIQELILIKVTPGPISEVLNSLENDWKELLGSIPFEVSFLDDGIQSMYEKEKKLSNLIYLFSLLAVLLACLGLYGLVAFSVHARLKEVGIRKVLGASIKKILYLLSRQFLILIMIAIIISVPLTSHFANLWLNNFAFRIDISWWMFAISGFVLLLVALFAISHHTLKAALTNPVKVLRDN